MHLSDERVEEFKKICEANGVSLTMDEAREEARQLLTLCRLLASPLPGEIVAQDRKELAVPEKFFPSPGPDDSSITLPLL